MTTTLKQFIGSKTLAGIAVSVLLLGGGVTHAVAGHGGPHGSGLLGGAIVGGAIGGAVKGKKGILPGAAIGAIVGGAASSAARPAPPPPPPQYYAPTSRPVYDSGLVYNIQASLTRLGYNPGPVDGVYGRRTADAISAYEYNNRLPVTGQPSEGVYYHMSRPPGG